MIITNLTLPTENRTSFIKSVRNGKENKGLSRNRNIESRNIETSETISTSDAEMRDPQEKENRNKKSRRHVCIIGDSMVKHITGPGVLKNDK